MTGWTLLRRLACLAFLTAIVGPSGVADQDSDANKASNQVSLDLIVRDRHGRPIRDLRPQEIRIVEDGAPATINRLRLVARNKYDPAEPRLQNRLVSIVLDELNSAALRTARKSTLDLIRAAGGSQVYFSIWQISDRLQLVQPFTTDAAKLEQALATAKPDPARLDGNPPALESLASDALSKSQKIAREEFAQPSVAGLLGLLRAQGAYPGRKSILYVSGGQEIKNSGESPLQAIVGAANRSEVSIYTINTAGLSPRAMNDASEIMMLSTIMDNGSTVSPRDSTSLGEVSFRTLVRMETERGRNTKSPLKELANATGGIYIDDPSNYRKPLRTMAEDIGTYYEATYSAPSNDFDGHFRHLAVSVTRPHARIQSRSGFLAVPFNAGTELAAFEMPLLKALSAANKTEAVPFRGQVFRFGTHNGATRAALVVEVPLSAVELRQDDRNKLYEGHLSFLALIKGSDGQVIRKLSRDVSVRGAAERLELSRAKTFTFERSFDVPPGEYRAEIAVSDQYANKLSVKTVNFSTSPDTRGLASSDIAAIAHFEPLDPALESEEPLLYQGHRVVPDLSFAERTLDPDLPIFFSIYPSPASSDKPRLEVEIRKGQALVATFPLQVPDAAGGSAIPFVTSIRRAAIPIGDYQLKVKVTQGGETREQSFDFVGTGSTNTAADTFTATPNLLNSQIAPSLLAGLAKPPQAELDALLEAVRKRALDYQTELPNLMCVEQTARSEDPSGQQDWKYKDSIVRLLRYVDGEERRDVLQLDGRRALGASIDGIQITGQFGKTMNMVLSERSQAKIDWQGMTEIAGSRTHVFRFSVSDSHSGWQLVSNAGGRSVQAAYDALLYIDADTLGIRRLSLKARDLQVNFPIQECVITVDYDYVSIGGHDYLVPQQATMFAREGAHHLKKNEIRFVNYRKYGSESTIKFGQ